MKTAISIPDETYERASRQATELGMSRSEFVTRAVQQYLERIESESLTQAINDAIALVGHDDSSADAVLAGRRFLARDEESW